MVSQGTNIRAIVEHLTPVLDRFIDLGSSLLRWRKMWTQDLDIAGIGIASSTPTAANHITNKAYVDAVALSSGIANLEEADGAPSYNGITTLRFDQSDGFVVTNPSGAIGRVDLAAIPASALAGSIDHGSQLTGLLDDDHTQYQLRTEKDTNSGYAGLTAGGVVSVARGGTNAATAAAARTSLAAAPLDPSFVTLGTNGELSNERVLTAGSGITITDAGAGSTVTIAASSGATILVGNARISRTDATHIALGRGSIPLKISGSWGTRLITSAVSVDTTGLAANTVYYAYASDSAGSTILELSATANAEDTDTGVRIKSGDATRTLVGMVRTNGSTQFPATDTLILSWFNRQRRVNRTSFTAARSTTSTTFVELNSEIRNDFLVWSGCLATLMSDGFASNTATDLCNTSFGIDDATPENAMTRGRPGTASGEVATTLTFEAAQSEGYHYATLVARVGANTGTWAGGTEPERCHLQVVVEG